MNAICEGLAGHPAPRTPRPHADPRRAISARRLSRLPGALQHGPHRASPSTSLTANMTLPAPPWPAPAHNTSAENPS